MLRIILVLITLSLVKVAYAQNNTLWLHNNTEDTTLIDVNSNLIRPIASITKIMTAMVALDYSKDLEQKLKLVSSPRSPLPKIFYTRRDLLNATLVKSDNAAAETLAKDYPGGRDGFIQAMNAKAKSLGMENTSFEDASGLSKNNVSTAKEVHIMLLAAMEYEFIKDSSVQKHVQVETYTKKQTKIIELPNTNRHLLFQFDNIVMSKTGTTSAAGYCVAMVVQQGRDTFTMVVLGTKNHKSRINTASSIIVNNIPEPENLEIGLRAP